MPITYQLTTSACPANFIEIQLLPAVDVEDYKSHHELWEYRENVGLDKGCASQPCV